MNEPDEQCWYAVYVRSRFEKKVHRDLEEKGITSFLPLLDTWRQWSDRRKKVQVPLFRGYVFVRINFRKEYVRVLETDGVVAFVGIKNSASVIRDREIEWIRILTGEPDAVTRVRPELSPGQPVRVVAGPFAGLEGVVSKEGRDAKLVVYFESIMQGIEVLINPDYLSVV
ncbi:MAG TPA: UpxY family transcription antiterminator [Prosthecochloris aestuarii]|uniref:UpxY family transcription antiterminator n=1 Tax=Prosthecochloris aestuarii TaxID=1102 RepID=A0A831SMZ3_PROAE|nr:UpxY family transcription antiterminator [Prosthecochloris aestuarii]